MLDASAYVKVVEHKYRNKRSERLYLCPYQFLEFFIHLALKHLKEKTILYGGVFYTRRIRVAPLEDFDFGFALICNN